MEWIVTLFILVIIIFLVLNLKLNPQFGGRFSRKYKQRYKGSKHWDGKRFVNLSPTGINVNVATLPKILKQQFANRKERTPEKSIEIIPFDPLKFSAQKEKPKFIWYGHSVLLLQLEGYNFLIDPMFGRDAAPIAPFASPRFSEDSINLIDSLPKIDAVFLTHDHYDHLDYASIKKLNKSPKMYFVALGISRHLERWGIPKAQIVELDWWEETYFKDIKIVFTPSRHFSGRGTRDKAKSLWGGYVFKTENHSIYWSGDGGYDDHFKEIGNKYGPFDWGFIECGQYNEYWHQIHMFPEESVQAAIDSATKTAIPVHWAGFSLAMHHWADPVIRFYKESEKQDLNYLTPQLGEIVVLGETQKNTQWWL